METNKRMKVYFHSQSKQEDRIYIEGDYLYVHYFGNYSVVALRDIVQAKISLVTRMHIPAQNLRILKLSHLFSRNNQGGLGRYFIDLDVVTKDTVYQFESMGIEDAIDLMGQLSQLVTIFEDPLGIIEAINKYSNRVDLYRYFEINYQSWAKLHHLDNPRKLDEDILRVMKKEIDKE